MKQMLMKFGIAMGVAVLAIIIAVVALNMPAPAEMSVPTPGMTAAEA